MFSRLWIIFLWSKQSVLDFGLAAYCLNGHEYAFFIMPNPVFPLTATIFWLEYLFPEYKIYVNQFFITINVSGYILYYARHTVKVTKGSLSLWM